MINYYSPDLFLLILIVSALLSVIISAICSLMEAALYAVPLPYVRYKAEEGNVSARSLLAMKQKIHRPISAILVLNTFSNTIGAGISGWAAGKLYGDEVSTGILFGLALLILIASEILPKQLGVRYSRSLSILMVRPLSLLVYVLSPLLKGIQCISYFFAGQNRENIFSQEELISMADMGTEEGKLHVLEAEVIRNLVNLREGLVKDIMTPRVVVHRLNGDTKINELHGLEDWEHSRFPLYDPKREDHVENYVTLRDIYRAVMSGNGSMRLSELSRIMLAVPEVMSLDKLFWLLSSGGEHICSVIDEYGGFAGIVTLEDLIERLLGTEIVDEYDTTTDLRSLAKRMFTPKNLST